MSVLYTTSFPLQQHDFLGRENRQAMLYGPHKAKTADFPLSRRSAGLCLLGRTPSPRLRLPAQLRDLLQIAEKDCMCIVDKVEMPS